MYKNKPFSAVILVSFIAALSLSGCAGEQKEAQLEVVDSEFSMRHEAGHDYVIDAKGVIRNVGDTDVRNVEVTGYCRSCDERIIDGQWFVSDYEKMEHQKDVIGYLPAGGQETFEFEEVAFYSVDKSKKEPDALPEDLEISIESYEVGK